MKKKILPTLAAVFFVPLSAIHAVEVQKLRCEYLKDPLGIDAAQPKSSDALMASQWIWYPEGNPANSAPAGLRYFQRTMEVDAAKTVESATASLSADNEFTLWINGKKVSEGKDFKVPVKSSIASFLRPGANVISVAVNNAGPAAHARQVNGPRFFKIDFWGFLRRSKKAFLSSRSHSNSSPFSICAASARAAGKLT
jgi:hypothetical protein